MSAGEILAVVIGGLLILAGIAWLFLAYFYKPAPRPRGAGDMDWLEKIVARLLKFVKDNFLKKALPGAFMIIVGLLIILVTVVFDSGGNDVPDEEPTPAVTAS